MDELLAPDFDLVTPDGAITSLIRLSDVTAEAVVSIENISASFLGFQLDPSAILFNIKSTLAQLGLDGIGESFELDAKNRCARVNVKLHAIGSLAIEVLKILPIGAYIGKLFAADDRRRVRDPDYLARYFGRSDRWGRPLLSLGGLHGSSDLVLEKIEGRTVAYLTLQRGRITYDSTVNGFLPTLAKALVAKLETRKLIHLHQIWAPNFPHSLNEGEILLVRTLPLHMRTVFGRVVSELLAQGYHHTTASILQPDTHASGDIYELYGSSKREITDIPLEFYTLEPYREHVFFSDRDQLQVYLDDSEILFKAFATAPPPLTNKAAIFVVKSDQLIHLKPEQWIVREPRYQEFPGLGQESRQALMVERFIKQQPSYSFLKSIDNGYITSQGILFSRYFPSPLMKRMLLSDQVQRCLKGIYFQYPSESHQEFFSAEDRALLHDLNKFAIPVFWLDDTTKKILQYVQKPERDSGLFVPRDKIETFLKSTVFGIYGSNLLAGSFEQELSRLLQGILEMRKEMHHPFLKVDTPIALVTGGGPGAMEVGNRVAISLGILSCANIVDFTRQEEGWVEQHQNPYIEAKMTYRLDKLVERQAEFYLDFPIFLIGGVGTDFEYSLEEVRRKVGATPPHPVLMFGSAEYWRDKVTSRFACNRMMQTIRGSEWLSNCFYCIETAEEGIAVYRRFFQGTLPIGPNGPIYDTGFVIAKELAKDAKD